VEDQGELGLEVGDRLLYVAGKDIEVAVVDDAEGVEGRLELVRLPVMGTKLAGGVPDGAGAEAGSTAVKDGHVHRNADDSDVRLGEVAGEGTAGEAVSAAVAGAALPLSGIKPAGVVAFAHAGDDSMTARLSRAQALWRTTPKLAVL